MSTKGYSNYFRIQLGKSKYIKASWILSFLLLPILVSGQDNWTLERCIGYAHENNIQLKQQELNVARTSNTLAQSKLDLLPKLNAGVGQTFRFGRSVDPLTYEFTTQNSRGTSFAASSGVVLFRGFQGINTIKKNDLDLQINLADYAHAKNDLALGITRFFLQVLFNQELLEITEQQVELSQQQLAQTNQLVKVGALANGDLLEMQAQLASEELNQVNAKNQLDLSLLDLAQLLDLENPDNFLIEQPGLEEIPMELSSPPVAKVYESSLLFLPQIKSAELNVQSSEKNLLLAKGSLSPSLSINSMWGTGYSDQIYDLMTGNIMPFQEQVAYSSTNSLRFYLNLPIFNNWVSRTSIKNANLDVLNSKYQLQATQNTLRKEIQQAYADAKAALKKYNATEKTLTFLLEAFDYANQKYAIGMLTSLDYKLAKNNLTKAQSELLQARYNFIFNSKILDFYRGNPIKLN